MRDIELEEGEAFILHEDDEENIDPDRDFSYIDKKIENFLGQYQKDFMGGLSAESLGSKYGGYGSFLPMQQRSPSVLSDQRTQSHVTSKSPQNLPSEQSLTKPAGLANNSIPVKSVPASSANSTQAVSESSMLPSNNRLKLQDASECASNKQQKEPMIHLPKQNSLKLRVKMTTENVLSYDKSAIYSGLGLDISPSSSPEDNFSDSECASLDMEVKKESPSCIIEIMTTLPLPNDELLSPLHDSLARLTSKENSVETVIPGYSQALVANSSHGNNCSEGKREASSIRKSKVKDLSKDRKLKKKELRKERTLKEEDQNVKHVELMSGNREYPANTTALSVNGKDESGTSGAEVANVSVAAVSGVDALSGEMEPASVTDKIAGSNPLMYDKKSKVRCSEEDIGDSMQQLRVAREKMNGVSASASSHDAVVENVNTLRGKTGVNKNAISLSQGEFTTDKRNEVECREDETNKFRKQQSSAKDKVKEGVLSSVCPKQDNVYRKEFEMVETASKDKEADLFCMTDVEGNDKHDVTYEEMRDCNVGTPKLSKQKTHDKVIPHSQVEVGVPSGKEHMFSMPKKKSRENQTDGRCTEAIPRENSVVGSSAAENGVAKGSIPSKSRKVESDLRKEMKKDDKVASNLGPNKKGKDASLKDFEMGVPEREIHVSPSIQKEKTSFKKKEIASNVISNIAGGLTGGNSVENVPVVTLPPAEIVPHDDWVQCDGCHKWRLLPLGMDPESLPKVWKCSMLTWLPGKNKCSVSEEETNAVYQPPVSTQMLNNQQAYPDVGAFGGAPGGIQHIGISGQTSNIDAIAAGSKRRDFPKTDLDAARRSGFQERIPVKKDQLRSSEFSSKNPKKLPRDLNAVRKSGDLKPSKFERKREADIEASGVPKKMKRVHQQSNGNPELAGLSAVEAKGESENNDPGPLEVSQDFGKRTSKSSLVKVKDRPQNLMIAKNSEIKDSGKKRKLKDRGESTTSVDYHPGRVQHQMKNSVSGNSASELGEERKERKSKVSNSQARECSADKRNSRTNSDGGKHSLGSSGDNSRHKRGRRDNIPLEERHAETASQRITNVRNSTEKALDFGLSDYATTSSSSKVSCKGKAKASEVKCSPIGSISSSPFRLSKCDSDKGTSKMPVSYKESDDLFPSKQLKSRAEGAFHEIPAHSEEIRDRKSNLSRSSAADATVKNHSMRNKSAGKRPGAHIIDAPINLEDCKDASYKPDHMIGDSGALISQHNLVSGDQVAKSSNSLRVEEASSRRMKAHDLQIGSEKEPSCHSYGIPETEEANGSYATNVDNVQNKLSREAGDDHCSLRHIHPSGPLSDIESSVKKGSSHRAAKTALKEATNLKHSADRLKISGSTNESTEVFFQAALKFLHGASLMEPGNNESVRYGEIPSTGVYSTTAALCEYCAHEYERGNNLATAALAYKCMEVAYMRVVYCNDLTASRDRMELQMAARAAPQVESPSSSASDVDNLNNQAATDIMKDGHSAVDHRAHIISAENRPNFLRLLNFTEDINRAMEASRRSQSAFAAANPILAQAGKHAAISSIKTVLDFSFHDVEEFLHLVRLAMEALGSN